MAIEKILLVVAVGLLVAAVWSAVSFAGEEKPQAAKINM